MSEYDHILEPVPGYEGLMQCKICTAAEGELPFHCPGFKLSQDAKEKIYGLKLDYIKGEWYEFPKNEAIRILKV